MSVVSLSKISSILLDTNWSFILDTIWLHCKVFTYLKQSNNSVNLLSHYKMLIYWKRPSYNMLIYCIQSGYEILICW